MTSRERVFAAARGGSVDRKPVLALPVASSDSDILIAESVSSVSTFLDVEHVVLCQVDSPFRRGGNDLPNALAADPVLNGERLESAVQATRIEISDALNAGADGILYRLFGAREALSTPMEYGGHYLERDRELLAEIQDANLNVLFLVGNEDLYMDFVSDLPAHVIAWDRDATGISSDTVRSLRSGAQASSDPGSEILLMHPGIRIADRIESI